MFSDLGLKQLYRVGEVQYQLSPPLVWPALQLTEEGLSLLFCRLRQCPGRNVADQGLWPVAQILSTTLGIQHKIIERNRLKVKDIFMYKIFLPPCFTFFCYLCFAGNDSHPSASQDLLDQNSEVAQVRDERTEQVCYFKMWSYDRHFNVKTKAESRKHALIKVLCQAGLIQWGKGGRWSRCLEYPGELRKN